MNPLVLMMLGIALDTYNKSTAAKSQQKVLNRAEKNTTRLSNDIVNTTEDTASELYDPQARAAQYESMASKAEDSLGEALAQATADTEGANTGTQGRVSSDYIEGKAKSMRDSAERASTLARLMARVRAPSDLTSKEGISTGRMAGELRGLGAEMARMAQAYSQDAAAVQPNPWLGILAGGMSGYGMGKLNAGTTSPAFGGVSMVDPGPLTGDELLNQRYLRIR